MGLPMLYEQDALMAKEEEVVAAEPAVAVAVADADAMLRMNEEDDWEL